MEFLDEFRNIYRYYTYNTLNNGKKADEELLWYPSRFHKFLCDEVQRFLEEKGDNPYDILILSTPPQHGKAQADDTPILTKDGWKNHGDLRVGDYVLNHKGEWVMVTDVHPKVMCDCKVTFTNGEEIYCHENHEWLIHDRSSHKERILETKDMEKRVSYGSQDKKRGHRYNFMLPIKEFVAGEEKDFDVNPYVLGVWLGDGTNTSGQICACEEDRITIDECRKHFPKGKEWKHKDTGVISATFNGMYRGLQKYGMCFATRRTDKYIPEDYLTASITQRLDLLAGLIDTDGYADKKHNRMVFTTADEKLKDTFEDLIATFGWRTTTCECKPVLSSSGIQGKHIYWQIAFNPTVDIPCRIKRKHLTAFSKQRRISICSIERVVAKQGNCITVDGGIYLCGRKMIPTHNSITITGTLPSWYLSRNPDKKCIIVSYGDDNAKKFGKMNLDKFKKWSELFGLKLDKGKANAKEWRIDGHEGVCISAGYGGTITSNSANLMVIDDPVKNAVQADSEKDRDTKWDDFLMTLDSRMSAGGKIILIMTRWHENDLAGMLLETMPDQCRLINIPLIAEEDNDPLGRKKGEAILTEPDLPPSMQKNTKWALNKKKILSGTESGTRTWNALWQGRPSALEGNLIKREWWQFYDASDYEDGTLKFERMIMTVDAAFKDTKKNDYVAIGVWGKKGGRIYLVDMINEHLSFSQTVRKIRVLSAKHQKVKGVLIEEAANGSAIISTLQKQSVMGVVAVHPDNSKEARVQDCSFYIEAGNVYLPRDKNFTWELIDQFAVFPNGKHDDIVDMSTMAIRRLSNMRTMRDMMRSVKVARDDEWNYQKRQEKLFREEMESINVY